MISGCLSILDGLLHAVAHKADAHQGCHGSAMARQSHNVRRTLFRNGRRIYQQCQSFVMLSQQKPASAHTLIAVITFVLLMLVQKRMEASDF